MDGRPGKIRQTSTVVEVHVRQDNVANILRLVSKPSDMVDRRFRRIKGHVHDDPKKACKPGGVGVVIQPQASIDQHKSLVGFGQQAEHAGFPIIETGITGEAIH
jgi:hypothetical protein